MSCGSAGPSTIGLARVDHLAFVHQDVLVLGHQFLVRPRRSGSVICRRTLPLVSLPKDTVPVDFGQHALVLGRAGFEQLGHARQTAGDVAGLLAFDRDTRQHFARAHVLAVAHLISAPTWKPMVTE